MGKQMNVLIAGNLKFKKLIDNSVKYGLMTTAISSKDEIDNISQDIIFDVVFIEDGIEADKFIELLKSDIHSKSASIILIQSAETKISLITVDAAISGDIEYTNFASIMNTLLKFKKLEEELHDLQDDFCMDYSADIADDLRKYELEALNAISLTISESLDLQIVLDLALGKILEISGIDMGMIYFVSDDRSMVKMAAQHGLKRKVVEAISSFPVTPGSVAAQVIESYLPLVRDAFQDSEFPVTKERFESVDGLDVKTLIAIPLISREQIIGILYLCNSKIKIITSNDIEILTLAANQVGIAIDNARLYKSARFELEERRKAEQKLCDTVTLYNRVIDDINDVVFSSDTNGRILYMSRVVEKIFGYTQEEVIGKPFTVYVHQNDLPILIKKFQSVLEGKREASKYRIRRKDGTYLWVRSSSKVFYIDGKPAGINGVITDITGIQINEAEFEDKFNLLNKMIDDIPGFVFKLRHSKGIGWIFDYISDNAEDVGYSPLEIQKNFMLFIGALRMEDQGALWAELDDSLRNHTKIEIHLRYRNRDGNEVNMQFAAQPEIWNENDATWHGFALRLNEIALPLQNKL